MIRFHYVGYTSEGSMDRVDVALPIGLHQGPGVDDCGIIRLEDSETPSLDASYAGTSNGGSEGHASVGSTDDESV